MATLGHRQEVLAEQPRHRGRSGYREATLDSLGIDSPRWSSSSATSREVRYRVRRARGTHDRPARCASTPQVGDSHEDAGNRAFRHRPHHPGAGVGRQCEPRGAVSEAGGLGIIAAGGAPLSWIEEQVRIARTMTDKPIGVNIMLMNPEAPKIAQLLADLRVDVITTGAEARRPTSVCGRRQAARSCPSSRRARLPHAWSAAGRCRYR